jgi:hypothetical protein
MTNEEIINFLEKSLRKFILFLYGWLTTDAEILGYILGVCHFIIAFSIFLILVVAHTIYPALWLQSIILFGLGLIWFQHITLKVCISTIAEERFTNTKAPFFTIVEDMTKFLNISFNKLLDNIIIAETMAILCFGLALIGRISVLLHKRFSIPY